MRLLQFLEDDRGMLSSTRLVYLAWSFVLLGIVIWLTITNKAFPKLEPSLVLMFATVVTGKAVQSFSENVTPTSTSTTVTTSST